MDKRTLDEHGLQEDVQHHLGVEAVLRRVRSSFQEDPTYSNVNEMQRQPSENRGEHYF